MFRKQYGVTRVAATPTGVDLDIFARPEAPAGRDGTRLKIYESMAARYSWDAVTQAFEKLL